MSRPPVPVVADDPESREMLADVLTAIQMRICWIETGTVTMRTADLLRIIPTLSVDRYSSGSPSTVADQLRRMYGAELRELSLDQKAAIVRMEKAVSILLNGRMTT